MKPVALLLVALSVTTVVRPLHAQGEASPERGLGLARQVCAECHAIQPQQIQSPNGRAPTFLALSTTPGMTRTALTVALTTPHAGMPMFRLTAEQRTDLIAYIMSLHQAGAPPGK